MKWADLHKIMKQGDGFIADVSHLFVACKESQTEQVTYRKINDLINAYSQINALPTLLCSY